MIKIHSNGSKWAGQKVDSIDELLRVLSKYTLDPMFEDFEDFGNFVQETENGTTIFFGNFKHYSHVFRLETDEEYLIKKLTDAIRKNQNTVAYKKLSSHNKKKKELLELAKQNKENIFTMIAVMRKENALEDYILDVLKIYLEQKYKKYKAVAEEIAWQIIYCNALEK
jgi:hypothetical protein